LSKVKKVEVASLVEILNPVTLQPFELIEPIERPQLQSLRWLESLRWLQSLRWLNSLTLQPTAPSSPPPTPYTQSDKK